MLRIALTTELEPLLAFYKHLGRGNRETIGRVTPMMLDKYARTKRLHTLYHDHDPLGYIIANDTSKHPARTRYPNQMRIYVACIDYAVQRRLHGTMLVDHITRLAQLAGLDAVGLWCANDIPARDFWTALGFTARRERKGGRKRGRMLTEYTLPLTDACSASVPPGPDASL